MQVRVGVQGEALQQGAPGLLSVTCARFALQEGHPPRPLHQKVTRSSSLQLSQRTRAKPCASTPHSRYLARVPLHIPGQAPSPPRWPPPAERLRGGAPAVRGVAGSTRGSLNHARRGGGRQRASHGPGSVWPCKPPASCFPENGLGLASLVDVYKWCGPGVHRGVPPGLLLEMQVLDSTGGPLPCPVGRGTPSSLDV